LQGGGVFLDGHPITRTASVIAGNHPDQCFGCDSSALARATAAGRGAAAYDRTVHGTPLPGTLFSRVVR
jgi:hypothetical protein